MNVELESNHSPSGAVTVTIRGEIDMNSSSKVREHLSSLFAANQKAVVVDLSAVSYIDSSGIATLVEGLQWSHSSKSKFRLAGLTPAVKDVFEIAHLLTVFEIFDSREDALEGV